MTEESSRPEDLRTEYAVIGSYVTAMTGMRFQTVAIFLAAVGLIGTGGEESLSTGLLILFVSVGLWILDLRNREILRRLGDRGIEIESGWHKDDDDRSGFFRGREKRAEVRFLGLGPWVPGGLAEHVVRHAVAVDIVFLGVAVYAITLFF